MHSIDKKWITSSLYIKAKHAWQVNGHMLGELFEHSQEFRDARYTFRKTVNESWGREAC